MLTCFICDDTATYEPMEEAVPAEEVPLDHKEVMEMEFLGMVGPVHDLPVPDDDDDWIYYFF